MGKRMAIGVTAGALVLALGYETLDVFDVVPGPLTRDSAAREAVPEPGKTAVGPSVAPPAAPASPAALPALAGPQPDPAKVKAKIAAALKDPDLSTKVAIDVRDGMTGAVLAEQSQNDATTPASTTKLLTAWAVANTMDLDKPLTTKVVSGASPDAVTLVAGGDTALNPGKGDPNAVSGHAGLADLAAQVAGALKRAGRTSVTVDVDTSYAPGPLTAARWDPGVVAAGYTARIAQLGLSTERATDPATPTPTDPVGSTQQTFVKALAAQGITAKKGASKAAPKDAQELGRVESAPLVDVLGDALQASDNAMIESLARQAAFGKGIGGSTAEVTKFVENTLKQGGFNLAGVKLADTSGLSDGTTIPPRVLADVLLSGTTGKNKPYAETVSRLGVGGLNGTLHNRFEAKTNSSAAGLVRAKTGSLLGVASLAGTVVTKDNRLLVFAVISNGPQASPYVTRDAIDNIVADLASCGCN
ncbi:D-alanyl-D-alanine carboxypeptidase/D-alanyl-D-alanine-endopeptidase [Flexivirga sp. ID2601S]|uniref:D-alanyl-D-alanine carboxypeptidase/D-alanyl-D-alanine-endopeptidase n=1 Tax=Flexivirga aerilata TaxID=1656889 RepID=A0A849ADZ1_9MICO|nr:D-alanyl-D-alanine carboxypeptidase/D-alanyl-D-alanine-endopeptidase [Flexivirga aerilata]NNG37993.1 D-alanyl-D-alanine carboxypeptidase/D-alanyl-D-alanine-endopeptidase [Flexivirga aerilata]